MTEHIILQKKHLNGFECEERHDVIHPETCAAQIVLSDSENRSLEEWILGSDSSKEYKNSLEEFLSEYYEESGNGGSSVKEATIDNSGTVKLSQSPTSTSEELFPIGTDSSDSNRIKTHIPKASNKQLGVVKVDNLTDNSNTTLCTVSIDGRGFLYTELPNSYSNKVIIADEAISDITDIVKEEKDYVTYNLCSLLHLTEASFLFKHVSNKCESEIKEVLGLEDSALGKPYVILIPKNTYVEIDSASEYISILEGEFKTITIDSNGDNKELSCLGIAFTEKVDFSAHYALKISVAKPETITKLFNEDSPQYYLKLSIAKYYE